MQTIFVTISRGGTARNILQSEAVQVLLDAGLRLVILTPACNDKRFLETFSKPGIIFEPFFEPRWTRLDNIFVGLHKALVYNASTVMRDKYGILSPKETNIFKYHIKRFFLKPLRNLGFLKEFVRYLDTALVKDVYYRDLFKKYAPCAIFSTSITEDMDVFVLKQARASGAPIIGMPKTWDNLSKISVRVKPDKMIVWGKYSFDEAVRFQNMKPENVVICGIPQFDVYRDKSVFLSREEFFRLNGLDSRKKILLYGSEGKYSKNDADIVQMIRDAARRSVFPADCQIFVRPHFMYPGDEEKFSKFKNDKDVVVDNYYARSDNFRDNWDYSLDQMRHLAQMLANCDMLITTASTLTLDVCAFDKPIINVAFDGYEKKDFAYSIAKWYTSEYYRQVVDTGAPWLVRSEDELLNAIREYLANPSLRKENRARLRDYFCGPIDGQSGRRIGEEVIKFVNSTVVN